MVGGISHFQPRLQLKTPIEDQCGLMSIETQMNLGSSYNYQPLQNGWSQYITRLHRNKPCCGLKMLLAFSTGHSRGEQNLCRRMCSLRMSLKPRWSWKSTTWWRSAKCLGQHRLGSGLKNRGTCWFQKPTDFKVAVAIWRRTEKTLRKRQLASILS